MKRLVLISAAALASSFAWAQHSKFSEQSQSAASTNRISVVYGGDKIQLNPRSSMIHAKATGTPFITENFGTGTSTSLPTGWTATGTPSNGGTWKWIKQQAAGAYSIPALASTTASNGWMIFDSDSIGTANGMVVPFEGSLISPTYSTLGHNTIQFSFQEHFRFFTGDTCWIGVSTNGGTSWTDYLVSDNLIQVNTNTTNPYTARVNLTPTAANQASVKFRFRQKSTYAGGTYNWLVDDMAISELDPVDVGLDNSALIQETDTANPYVSFTNFSAVPLQFVDTVFPVVDLSNYGSLAQAPTKVKVNIYNNGSSVFTDSVNYANLPVNSLDSLINTFNTGYKPTATGAYTGVFAVNQAGDANALDNTDTVRFNVTDSTYSTYGAARSGSYYIHRATSLGTEISYYQGSRFDIARGKSDTLTSVSVSFNSTSTRGVKAVVQIYKVASTGTGTGASLFWQSVAATQQKVLDTTDFSISTAIRFTTFRCAASSSTPVTRFVLGPGTYCAVVTAVGATSSQTLLVNSNGPVKKRTGYTGYYGQSDTSQNTATFNYGTRQVVVNGNASDIGVRTGMTAVPLIMLNFASDARTLLTTVPSASGGVSSLVGVTVGAAYPNPANTILNVPVTVKTTTALSLSLYNMQGQIVMTKDLGNVIAGQSKTATLPTASLPSGTYIYSVESDNGQETGRVVITH